MGDAFDPLGHAAESYRTCTECGGDCEPQPVPTDAGMRIAFTCSEHGVHSFIDPFADLG
ncbi:hypothetical protein GCM10009713_02260 [Brevibacterium celere]